MSARVLSLMAIDAVLDVNRLKTNPNTARACKVTAKFDTSKDGIGNFMRFLELARLGYITFGASHKTHFNQYEDIVYQHRRVPNDEVSFYFTVLVGSHNLDSMKLAFSRVVSLDWEFPKQ